jgi:hypothetical protein
MQPPSSNTAHSQSLSFPHRAFAPISGCGDWVQEKHIQRVIAQVLPSISTSDFTVQLLPYPDNPSKIKSTIVAFSSQVHFEALLAQRPSAVLSIQKGLHPLKFSALRASASVSLGKAARQSPNATIPASASAPSAAPTPVAILPASVAPWAALARESVGETVKLAEVIEEQEEQSEGQWQHVQHKGREPGTAAAAASTPSDLKLYAYLLPSSATRASVVLHFGPNVTITGPYPSAGVAQGKAHCWLSCSNLFEYNRLLELNNSIMLDHQIRVEAARPKRSEVQHLAAPAPARAMATQDGTSSCHAAAEAAAPDGDCSSCDSSKWYTSCDAAGQDISQVLTPLTFQMYNSTCFSVSHNLAHSAPVPSARRVTFASQTLSSCSACASTSSTKPASQSGSRRRRHAPTAASTSLHPPCLLPTAASTSSSMPPSLCASRTPTPTFLHNCCVSDALIVRFPPTGTDPHLSRGSMCRVSPKQCCSTCRRQNTTRSRYLCSSASIPSFFNVL